MASYETLDLEDGIVLYKASGSPTDIYTCKLTDVLGVTQEVTYNRKLHLLTINNTSIVCYHPANVESVIKTLGLT